MDKPRRGKFLFSIFAGTLFGIIFDNLALGILFGLFVLFATGAAKRSEPQPDPDDKPRSEV
ncbi:hypothetical protein [Stakelama tenebrarum]|uniref:Uncharacterized protein n=1 Tax=Stakelama tenebrarum TaxID=2711215 RepID=A0A6G6Y7V9_9SPHN|nr:hypothetical protein [Sphingosinithalassobacter tenebrarum]QIG80798.1 hypothetical protein G5C33_14040 [Sphingosinithalassobacter tenebrarum]